LGLSENDSLIFARFIIEKKEEESTGVKVNLMKKINS
jgi:hypothetical protein